MRNGIRDLSALIRRVSTRSRRDPRENDNLFKKSTDLASSSFHGKDRFIKFRFSRSTNNVKVFACTRLTNFYLHQECMTKCFVCEFISGKKMCYLLLLLLLPIVTSELCAYPWYQYDTCQNNSLSCPSDQKCMFIEYCSAVVSLMDRNVLSAHR